MIGSLEIIQKTLKKELSPQLYKHSGGVAETAADLARLQGEDEKKARIAGWLHDCARGWSDERLLSFAREQKIIIDEFSLEAPVLLHAPVATVLALTRGVNDSGILASIRNHTLGAPEMSMLELIVYVADKIEPGRNYPGVDHLRHLARSNFKEAVLYAASQSILYILEKKQSIHPMTLQFWNWLVAWQRRV